MIGDLRVRRASEPATSRHGRWVSQLPVPVFLNGLRKCFIAFRQQFRHEALALGYSLDLDRDRIDGVL